LVNTVTLVAPNKHRWFHGRLGKPDSATWQARWQSKHFSLSKHYGGIKTFDTIVNTTTSSISTSGPGTKTRKLAAGVTTAVP
jgi:hypothetical protein